MIINVLGLGSSLELFQGGLSIGVNDIWSKVKTDYVLCLDKPERFTLERLRVINECKPLRFYSQLDDYSSRDDFERIELQPDFPKYICQINLKQLPKSLCSPFVACCIAYKLGAKQIHVYGVDLLNHPHLDKGSCERIKLHFYNLKVALVQNNCELIIHGNGILKNL